MHILVTGGTGFIGSALVRTALAAGHEITVLSRNPAAAIKQFDGRIAAVNRLDAGCTPPQAIVNLAGQNLGSHRWNEHWKQVFIDSRVGVTQQLADYIASLQDKPKVLISGSAIGYYGARGDEMLPEDAAPGDEYQARLCQAWEAAAQPAADAGVRTVLARFGLVLAGHGGSLPKMLLPFRLGLGGKLGDGQQWLSWIHLHDVVGLIMHAIEHVNFVGPVNFTAPDVQRNVEFCKTLGRVLHRPVWARVPGWAVRLQAGEMAHLLLTGQRVPPARAQALGYHFLHPDLPGALTDILRPQDAR